MPIADLKSVEAVCINRSPEALLWFLSVSLDCLYKQEQPQQEPVVFKWCKLQPEVGHQSVISIPFKTQVHLHFGIMLL